LKLKTDSSKANFFNYFKGQFKLLIKWGKNNNTITNDIEVLNMQSSMSNCTGIPNFPIALANSKGMLLPNGTVIVCGGRQGKNLPLVKSCFQLISGNWTLTAPMKTIISNFEMISSPFLNSTQLGLAIGELCF